jgi:hypothetical protein
MKSTTIDFTSTNETWVHNYEPKTTLQSMEWKHPMSPEKKKKFKLQPTARKVIHTLFWDSQGTIFEHHQE